MGSRHEIDVSALDAVPNAMPCRYCVESDANQTKAATADAVKGRHRQAGTDCLCPCVGRFEVRYVAMHSPTLLRNAKRAILAIDTGGRPHKH